MKIEIYLLVAALIYGIWKTHLSVRRSKSEEERFFAIRVSAFTWLVSIILVVAFIFLPNRQRIMFLLPAFVIIISILRLWKTGRLRIRREREEKSNFDRAKRLN